LFLRGIAIFSLSFICGTLHAQRQVAITIDDLPVSQSGKSACDYSTLVPFTSKMLKHFADSGIPIVGFVIGGNCPSLSAEQRREVLRMWRAAGAELGNHSFSHTSLNTTPIEDYERDILRAEPILRDVVDGGPIRYFRSPMLHTGLTSEVKERLEGFLADRGYQQAPVTFDNSDYAFAFVYSMALERGEQDLARRVQTAYIPYMDSVVEFFEKRSVEVVGREFPQVLLLHANHFNSEMIPALLTMLGKRGYEFVSLEHALRDPAYRLPNNYAGRGGFSWIHRWSMTQGMPNKGEPEPPEWLMHEYNRLISLGRSPDE
jgi:peptidoglycan/xylan/chitin deacetylase (PgdA/CDA1 family)